MSTVGFIGPPDWDDPSPAEYAALSGHATIGTTLDGTDFGWTLEEIAEFERPLTDAATELVARGADIVAITGTPFGWAGVPDGGRPHDRNERISSACGVPVVSAVSGVIDQLAELGAARLGLAATYYDDVWLREWSALLTRLGFDVAAAASLVGAGLVEGTLSADDPTHWAPTPEMIEANIAAVRTAPDGRLVDAVVVSGAGARTALAAERLETAAGVPVVASDTALYRAIDRQLA